MVPFDIGGSSCSGADKTMAKIESVRRKFGQKSGQIKMGLVTFKVGGTENFKTKVGFWSKKVGFWSLLKIKVGREKLRDLVKNRLKTGKNGLFWAIFCHF